mmetsp:Transcript_10334/g.40189  ORF Transcript_10334/g.40189 Transcript_10334/m.40189 type:complete len:263 (-) Transcript_10334:103-891(-)
MVLAADSPVGFPVPNDDLLALYRGAWLMGAPRRATSLAGAELLEPGWRRARHPRGERSCAATHGAAAHEPTNLHQRIPGCAGPNSCIPQMQSGQGEHVPERTAAEVPVEPTDEQRPLLGCNALPEPQQGAVPEELGLVASNHAAGHDFQLVERVDNEHMLAALLQPVPAHNCPRWRAGVHAASCDSQLPHPVGCGERPGLSGGAHSAKHLAGFPAVHRPHEYIQPRHRSAPRVQGPPVLVKLGNIRRHARTGRRADRPGWSA